MYNQKLSSVLLFAGLTAGLEYFSALREPACGN